MTFKKTLPLLLAATLATAPAFAEDGFNLIGGSDAQVEKAAKAPREKNDGHWLENQAKGFAAGTAAGVVNGAVLGAAALNPLVAIPTVLVISDRVGKNANARINLFYSGTVTRGRIVNIEHSPTSNGFGWWAGFYRSSVKVMPESFYGFNLYSFPSDNTLKDEWDAIHLDVDGPNGATVFALVKKCEGYKVGDIVDVKAPVGVFALNTQITDNLRFDFNKHMPRVVALYCKHDQPCQNDYDSSLGVLYRHQDKEFPPSQYLIDPAIIAADQAKMRKEEAEKKAAANSGSFSFM